MVRTKLGRPVCRTALGTVRVVASPTTIPAQCALLLLTKRCTAHVRVLARRPFCWFVE